MKIRVLLVVLVIAVLPISCNAGADEYISDPSRIPMFDSIQTPFITPGESGTFKLTIENRYDDEMVNVNLTVGFYAVATTAYYIDISDVDHPPTVEGEREHTLPTIPRIENDTLHFINFTIKTHSDTTEGTYFVRFQLEFEYNNSVYIMKSKGHFSDEEWLEATSRADEDDPGRIDIEYLGVDGIIPDSSVRVARKIPMWPLYVCLIPLIVMLLVLAFLFYCQEEYNMFPWLDQGFKYWTGKLHQFWRLLKHRFG